MIENGDWDRWVCVSFVLLVLLLLVLLLLYLLRYMEGGGWSQEGRGKRELIAHTLN
ncbi:hypothetical protein L227DRAFT_577311 [Lentinus tigrinus ALCF2SS1-6]|uniref:Uncharacterized protein n=1 Tax=Lentinus tigrinus ALCF2SS1-6 TaxID=1328759 RepID=A0A5C2S430_9APHY|nr:hypothetical protein L227DRAFT_577311 [Lentinus tigrinus ALCF2SS1-6]